jgi:PKD repeat protein
VVLSIPFSELADATGPEGFEWLLNGDPLGGDAIDIGSLSPSPDAYVLSHVYTHPQAPNCSFSNACSFFITALTMPVISGDASTCLNSDIALEASNNAGFEGQWTFVACPANDCPDNTISNAESLEWPTVYGTNSPGIYTVQYTGTCLDTALFQVELFDLPPFNILSNPGEVACAEDTITVSTNYLGTASIASCLLLNAAADTLLPSGDCSWTLLPEELAGPYTMLLTDTNACANVQSIGLNIQMQPFTFDCSLIDSSYCDNSPAVVTLSHLLSSNPANGSLEWFINGMPYNQPQIVIENLVPFIYELSYVYTHGEAPNCTFSNSCSFAVTPLTVPVISGEVGFCAGENVELWANNTGGYPGDWVNVSCPSPPCIPDQIATDQFVWSSTGSSLGVYTVSFGGECLQTMSHTFSILDAPVVAWIPADATPCLNECFPFSPDVLDNYTTFGWLYQTAADTASLSGNEVCFESIGNPPQLDICLWAELNHVVQGQSYTCRVDACESIEPVFSPGNYPEVQALACPGETVVLDVDYGLYNDCFFSMPPVGEYDNCSAIQIPDSTYGTYSYALYLSYQGCVDTLFGDLFILQPPSALLETEYDPCIADVWATLDDIKGDLLEFQWSLSNNPGDDFGFLLDANNESAPVPNPIPFSNLFLPTDSTFYVEVMLSNVCDTLILTDTIHFIAKPDIAIDITGQPGGVFCLPVDVQFEIGQFATQYIDSVMWNFSSIYDYGHITDTTYYNLEYPPPFGFENNGIADTIYVFATAYNICGTGSDSLQFVIIPPVVYIEMPDWAEGVCPGNEVVIPTLQIEGNPVACSVSSEPLIAGLIHICHEGLDSVTVGIPLSTPPGIYTIATTVSGCGSWTDYSYLEVFPVPKVDFNMPPNACTNEEISFFNLTESAVAFQWDFGIGNELADTSSLAYPDYAYPLPGVYGINLTATSEYGCIDSTLKWIDIFGPDPQISISDDQLCSGDSTYLEFPDQEGLVSIYWEYLLPGIDTLIFTAQQGVNYAFENQSTDELHTWELTVELEDIYGCRAKDTALLYVFPVPHAYFTHEDLEACAQAAEIQFNNLSTQGVSSQWDFNDPRTGINNVSFNRNPTHIFSKPGEYFVRLRVQNQYGCRNDFTRRLGCDILEIYVPNAFSPDGNGINEVFIPIIHGIAYLDTGESDFYLFEIFDRWGELIFTTRDPYQGWNGSGHSGTHYAKPEVYNWRLMLNTPYKVEIRKGHVVLLR